MDVGMNSEVKTTTTFNNYELSGIKRAKPCGILQDSHTITILSLQ